MKISREDYRKMGPEELSVCTSVPASDGFFMPGEFEPHDGCIMIWPSRPGSWSYGARAARIAFRNVIAAIAQSEKVYVAAGRDCMDSAVKLLLGEGADDSCAGSAEPLPDADCRRGAEPFPDESCAGSAEPLPDADCRRGAEPFPDGGCAGNAEPLPDADCRRGAEPFPNESCAGSAEPFPDESCDGTAGSFADGDWSRNVEIFPVETDDAWARDIAPTFVTNDRGQVRAVNWEFNAWGGTADGLYASWDRDNAFAKNFCARYGYECYDASPFVLEGGSIHSDGEGTLLVTEACLLSAGRNPALSKEEIEANLKRYLGAEKVLWLPRGIYLDETNEHVDNVCAFLGPGEVVLAWTDNEEDPQYPLSKACLDYLLRETDAKGRKLVVHKLPVPDVPVRITEEELAGYTFEEGEDAREAGERLAASYVNFYFSNEAVVMPVFGGENKASDERAVELMRQWNPGRRVIAVAARDILAGGGNIHCITQQIPVKQKVPAGRDAHLAERNGRRM